uniref:hypothetical protein n=1 Tax=Marinobacterium profundum TaxID=1714300 RepID=UPI00082B41E7|nr:hypothetical protein [Marinobacterium profundum]
MNKQRMISLTLATALFGLIPTISLGAEDSGQRRPKNGPPPEAFEACKGKQVGDVVGITGRRGEPLEANCQEEPAGKLVAVPTSMPGGKR